MKDTPARTRKYCPNCHYPLPSFGEYCSNCGQKYTTGRVYVWRLVGDFLESVLNIDSKIFRTLGSIFVPGKLTTQYFKGHHKRYIPPLRLFFVMAVIHFAILGFIAFDELEEQVKEQVSRQVMTAHQADFRDQVDSARNKVVTAFPNDPAVEKALDSLANLIEDTREDTTSLNYIGYEPGEGLKGQQADIPTRDMMEMPLDSLAQKYGGDHFLSRLQVRQYSKLIREGGSFARFAISNLIWMVVLMMPALALLLKLLYIRRNYYYVEHLVFSFHYHAFAFLLFSIVLLFIQTKFDEYSFFLNDGFLIGMAFLWVLIYLYKAMRRFYKQHWFKTFVKFSIINLSYTFIFTLFLLITFLATALIY